MISTLGGLLNLNHLDQSSRANDVIVVRHKDGSLHSTPFNVRFGRRQMWSNAGRAVQVEVNGELTTAVMKIGKGGEAYWLQPTYGAFEHDAHRNESPDKVAKSMAADGNPTPSPSAAAATATTTVAAAGDTGGGLSKPIRGSGGNPSLSVSSTDLRPFSIHPELPAKPSAGGTSPRETQTCTVPKSAQGSSSSTAPPPASSLAVTVKAETAAQGPSQTAQANAESNELRASLHSPDSSTTLPLLHRGDNGDLVVEPRAIHSAEDVQEARLALQAMAAAEKSRLRLSRLRLKEDALFLPSAEPDGQLDAAPAAAAVAADAGRSTPKSEEVLGGTHEAHVREVQALQKAAETVEDKEKAADAAAADDENVQAPSPPAAPAEAGGEAAVPEPPIAASPIAATPRQEIPPVDVGAAGASSADSVSSSTDRYKVEDVDDYFLDPIDADEYVAQYGEEELLKNLSFSSSVTSGISITDTAMGSAGSDVAKTWSTRHTAGDAAGAAVTATKATHSSAAHDTLLSRGRAGDKGDASPPAAPSATVATKAKPEVSKGGAMEVLDAEGWVVHPLTASATGGPYFTRTLIPVEADLWKLRLKDGCNKVRYLARKDKGEVVSISCNIFLWNWTDRLVVSDVDGTITKSDLWGHFYAMLGKGGDWTHPGICNLYTKISLNGYRMVYLTARSVSQINQTKSYLFTLQQDGVGLPLGPVLTAPQRFFTALTQEVSKQSHVFKIACLTSVRAAFPVHTKPFFAGFGNRYNDVISYDAVSIPTHKIFIIDPSSVLHVCLVKQTYRDLGHLVDVTFPPLKRTPVLLRAPLHVRQPRDSDSRQRGCAHAAESMSGEGARRGVERHAYARGLLHRSLSASSSLSTSCSDVSSRSFSSELPEHGSMASENPLGRTAATSATGGLHPLLPAKAAADASPSAPQRYPPHEHPKHQHDHASNGDDEYHPVRHASAAFSLANSFCVVIGDESNSGVAASDSAAVPPSTAAMTSTHSGEDGSTSSAALRRVPPSHDAATAGRAGLPPTSSANSAGQLASGSATHECCGDSASLPLETTATASSTGRATGAAGVSSPELAAVTVPRHASITAADAGGAALRASTAPRPAATSSALLCGSANSSNVSLPVGPGDMLSSNTTRFSGPTYNYGQRGLRSAGVGGVYGAGVEDYEEEEVPVDSDFSSFVYWRMDPRDLIAPPVKAAASAAASAAPVKTAPARKEVKAETIGVPTSAGPSATAQSTWRASANSESRLNASQVGQQIFKSKETTAGDAGASTAAPSSSIHHPEGVQSRELTSPKASKDALAAAATSAIADAGDTVDAYPSVAAASKPSPASNTALSGLVTSAGATRSSPRDTTAAVKVDHEDQERSTITACANSSGTASVNKSSGTNETPMPADDRMQPLSLSAPKLAVAPPCAADKSSKSTTATTARRGFFYAFTFGRSQPSETTIESPNSSNARKMQELAKKKALAHPDAWEYYHAQQQQPPAPGANPPCKGSPSSAK
ncbi:putative lipin [Leptomonas seymouri]|uniref:Putative lipin n=1 Tax=Leptomonas seymouri TaxID=5684 RepID=A0A0N0P4R9_LEPSE|nr:putative lipin [Leptomonas seymouri]|eukprot:KPI85616.1 putative lipin [Leptomonas seymouri]